jgi:hypothetical protein
MRPVWFRCLGLPMLAGGLLLLADCAISVPVAGPAPPPPPRMRSCPNRRFPSSR